MCVSKSSGARQIDMGAIEERSIRRNNATFSAAMRLRDGSPAAAVETWLSSQGFSDNAAAAMLVSAQQQFKELREEDAVALCIDMGLGDDCLEAVKGLGIAPGRAHAIVAAARENKPLRGYTTGPRKANAGVASATPKPVPLARGAGVVKRGGPAPSGARCAHCGARGQHGAERCPARPAAPHARG